MLPDLMPKAIFPAAAGGWFGRTRTLRAAGRAMSALRAISLLALVTLLAGSARVALGEDLPEAGHEIHEVRIENDANWFILKIPTQASWAHWTLANPPRIIVDFADSRSVLPHAPGLYEIELNRGPVRIFRTSQFANNPLDRRVRMTLELSAITAYEARRVGHEVHVLVEAKGLQDPSAVLTAQGLHLEGPAREGDHDQVETLSDALADAFSPKPTKKTRQPEPKEEPAKKVDKDHGSKDRVQTEDGDHGVADQARTDDGHDGADDQAEADDGHHGADDHAETDEGDHGHDDLAEARTSAEPSRDSSGLEDRGMSDPLPLPKAAADSHSEAHGEDSASDPPGGETAQSDETPAPAREMDPVREMRRTLEDLLGGDNVERVTETPDGEVLNEDELNARLFPEEDFDGWEDYDEAVALESADSLRARRARSLLLAAVEDWMNSNFEGAEKRAERCWRYYGEYPAGDQAGLLLHEIYMTSGRPGKTAILRGVSRTPDTTYLQQDFFERLLEIYFESGDRESVLERMESWGQLYPDGGWYARYHYAFGREDFLVRKTTTAEEHLARIRPDEPRGAEALLMRARLADEDDRSLEALKLYRELARTASGAFALRGLARTADLEFQHGKTEAALDAYEELLAVDAPLDERVWAQYQIGNCHFLGGRVAEARAAYEELIESHPQAFWTRFARERLDSMGWENDVASRIEEMKNP